MHMHYLDYLVKTTELTTNDGDIVEIFELKSTMPDEVFDEWAIHFRQNYVADSLLDSLVSGTGKTKQEYLLEYKFPSATDGFGPGTRSGDFAELLVSDYLEFVLGFTVPRERYKNKFNRNSSTQGTDVIGFKIHAERPGPSDELITFEVKAKASGDVPENRLQDAINDSYKDPIRKGETLSALKQIYIEKGNTQRVTQIERFQNKPDRPYTEKYGAAAVHSSATYSETMIKSVRLTAGDRWLIVVKKDNLMQLIHKLYEVASQC